MKQGRVIEVHRTNFIIHTDEGVRTATVRGSFHTEGDFPKVGDYVSFEVISGDQVVITSVLPRSSLIKRKVAEGEDEQIIAANVDLLIVVMGLDGDFNLSRLERYLLLARQSEITALVVLNKQDVATNLDQQVESTRAIADRVPVIVLSALQGKGFDTLEEYLRPGTTAVLLGSSGAGKSTITNHLLQEERQAVQETRSGDARGRHTTTSRQLFTLQNGAFIIDTPGIRELALLESELDDQRHVFSHIEALAEECRFRNCDHEQSAGCAVVAALESGELPLREWKNYQKLVQERNGAAARGIKAAQSQHQEQNAKRAAQRAELIRRRRLGQR